MSSVVDAVHSVPESEVGKTDFTLTSQYKFKASFWHVHGEVFPKIDLSRWTKTGPHVT